MCENMCDRYRSGCTNIIIIISKFGVCTFVCNLFKIDQGLKKHQIRCLINFKQQCNNPNSLIYQGANWKHFV